MKLFTVLLFPAVMAFSCRGGSSDHSPFSNQDNEIIIELNHLTYTIAEEHDHFLSFIGVRALAMTHLAIHDAFNAIDPKYEQYAYEGSQPEADPIAASATAAQTILEKAYPERMDTIRLICGKWLSKVKEGEAKAAGINLGKASAEKIIEIRKNDGHEKDGDYAPMTKPGDYQYTPGYDWVWKPNFSFATPFTFDSLGKFRCPPPPALTSEAYTSSYNEVKAYGSKNSTVRSEDETNYAHWWAEFAEHGWNRVGRITAKKQELPIMETARMFALINMNIYDMYLVSFDSKYFYDTWRPYTAIREAANDGNPQTKQDPDWTPEMQTPPWPEYPSAHASVGAGGAEVVTHVYGTAKVSFTMESVMALPDARSRTYNNLDSAARDCADSRIMNGFHFRFATEEGKRQGRAVAKHITNNFLQPLK